MINSFQWHAAALATAAMTLAAPVQAQQAPAAAPAAAAAPGAAVAPGAAAAPATDSRVIAAELSQGLYEIVYSPAQDALFVSAAGNPADKAAPGPRILRLDPATLAVQAEIPLDHQGFGLALDDAANRLYATATLDGALLVVDTAANRQTGMLALSERIIGKDGREDHADHLREIVVDPAAHRLYATGLRPGGSTLYAVDTQTMQIAKKAEGFGYDAAGIALDSRAGRLYVSNLQGELFIVDAATLGIVATVESGGDQLLNLAVDGAAGRLYAVDEGHPRITAFRAETLPDYKPRGEGNQVLVLNAADGAELGRIATGRTPVGLCLNGAGRLFVTSRGDGSVGVFDTAAMTKIDTISTGGMPNGIACTGKGIFATIKAGENVPENSMESVVRIAF